MNPQLSDLPTGALVALTVLVLIQVALDVIALVDLFRRPTERVTFGNKWVWVAIILFVSMLGAILYLVVGRQPPPASGVAPQPVSPSKAQNVADALYGRGEEGESPDGPEPR